MKKIIYVFILLLIFISVANAAEVILAPISSSTKIVSPISNEIVFTKPLSIGSYGTDVMALKKIIGLELSTTTDSSASYTANTATQVKKLQEKYAIDILIPDGLSAGTGTISSSTIKKLNILANKYYIKLSDFTAPKIAVVVKTSFMSNLAIGSIGDEVLLLKSILNSDPSTALVPQNSTNIFDVATAVAVKKFQEKYANEILTPVGLKNGTGMVFVSTRKKLNALLNNTIASVQNISTTTIQTVAQKQTFTISNSGQTDGDAMSQSCDGTTLVVKKSGFGSTYETRSTNSSQCGGSTYSAPVSTYTPPVYTPTKFDPYAGKECTKKTYELGDWSLCGYDGTQSRIVTTTVSTTTCPYYDYSSAPVVTQKCSIPECPSDESLAVGGEVSTVSSCKTGLFTVHVMKAGTKYSYGKGIPCAYTKNRLLAFTPFAPFDWSLGYVNAPADLKALGIATPQTFFCATFSDTGNWRIMDPVHSQFQIQTR